MTNNQLIENAVRESEYYTDSDLDKYRNSDGTYTLHTSSKWKSMGYIVKKGEEARITTKLWRKRSDKDGYYLTKAYLYDSSQIIPDE